MGLVGLMASLCCAPATFTFTDCHPQVLQQLRHNIDINVSNWLKCNRSACNCDETSCSGVEKVNSDVTDSTQSVGGAFCDCGCNASNPDSNADCVSENCDATSLNTCPFYVSAQQYLEAFTVEQKVEDSSGVRTDLPRLAVLELDWELVADEELQSLAQHVDVLVASG